MRMIINFGCFPITVGLVGKVTQGDAHLNQGDLLEYHLRESQSRTFCSAQ